MKNVTSEHVYFVSWDEGKSWNLFCSYDTMISTMRETLFMNREKALIYKADPKQHKIITELTLKETP